VAEAKPLLGTSVTGPLGSLALSQLRPASADLALRAVRWHASLERLGVILPLYLVHDVGMLFAAPSSQWSLEARVPAASLVPPPRLPTLTAQLDGYRATLAELAEAEASKRAANLRPSDELVVAVLARLLGATSSRVPQRPAYASAIPFDPSIFERLERELVALYLAYDRSFELATLEALAETRLFVLTLSDALDTDTLRLFGMLGASVGALAQVDLLASFEAPEASDIVSFSLEILPSVLEAKVRGASGTQAAHGYSGIGTRGSIDSMVLSELAWDDPELLRRLVDHELLYYAREQSREDQHRVHHLLIDASASMRGDRQTFARGVALATGKKLLLEGEEVVYRFFDARLYEPLRAKGGQLPTAQLLSFKGERGRNPARVFAELTTDLGIAKQRDGRVPVVHLFTHAALYIPRETVQALRVHAHLAGVFILPSGGRLDLDYLDLLDAHWVVDHATLSRRDARSEAARSILVDADMKKKLERADDGAERGPASRGRGGEV
jgi:hypothetical protein